ncbi:hypothetical protein ACLM5J_07120 [Nocardioides sp. Bht2]|uniref:hypothetical protein n=1 Tax=Nocardioides sp. Bht2 TaxID=3392297 RepID=UPI0039B52954
MNEPLGMIEPPSARRLKTRGWRDPRLGVGLLLVAGSVLAGAWLVADADDTVEVWSAAHDLQPGERIDADDLVATRVRFADAQRLEHYLKVVDGVPDGVLQQAAPSGALLPAQALGEAADDQIEVAVSAPTAAVPPSVAPGTTVDVWVTADGADVAEAVLQGVRVVAAPAGDGSFAASTERQVVLAVPPDETGQVGRVLAAAQAGHVAITRAG